MIYKASISNLGCRYKLGFITKTIHHVAGDLLYATYIGKTNW